MADFRRHAARITGAATLLASLAACSGGTPTAASPPGPVSQNLTLSGPISGKLTSAPSATCSINTHGNGLTSPLTVDITGPLSGKTVNVTLRIDSYIGPGNYEAQRLGNLTTGAAVTDATNPDQQTQLNSSTGEISVGKNGSGTVDMTLGQETIRGSWRCR